MEPPEPRTDYDLVRLYWVYRSIDLQMLALKTMRQELQAERSRIVPNATRSPPAKGGQLSHTRCRHGSKCRSARLARARVATRKNPECLSQAPTGSSDGTWFPFLPSEDTGDCRIAGDNHFRKSERRRGSVAGPLEDVRLAPLLDQCDAVVHLAGIAHKYAGDSLYDRINHRATSALARAILSRRDEASGVHFVHRRPVRRFRRIMS